MPSTNRSAVHRRLAAVSVSTPETLEIYREDDGHGWSTQGFLSVHRKRLLDANRVGSLSALQQEALIFDDAPYAAMDGDGAMVFFALDQVDALYALPGWDEAARALVSQLMRRGTSVQRRYHNASLAEAVLA